MGYKVFPPATYILLSVLLTKLGTGSSDREDGLIKYIPPDTIEVYSPPGFGPSATNYTVPKEGTAHLHCPVKLHGDIPISFPLVSWVRLTDWHILTNGVVSYTKDDRISVLYREGSFDWILQIKFAQLQDAGTYECQISVPTGTISRKVQLHVFHPESYILVGNNSAPSYEFHVNQGSPITLTCTIPLAEQTTPPQYIFWYQNQHMVNYDIERAVSVTTYSDESSQHDQPRTESKLTIAKAGKRDEGNYTCSPSNAEKATVVIFVTRGDHASAKKITEKNGEMLDHLASNSFLLKPPFYLPIVLLLIFSHISHRGT